MLARIHSGYRLNQSAGLVPQRFIEEMSPKHAGQVQSALEMKTDPEREMVNVANLKLKQLFLPRIHNTLYPSAFPRRGAGT